MELSGPVQACRNISSVPISSGYTRMYVGIRDYFSKPKVGPVKTMFGELRPT